MTAPIHASTARFSYETQDELIRKLSATLHRLGYVVTKAGPERTSIGELAARVGRSTASIWRSMQRKDCPAFESMKGKRRILWIEPNDQLLSYLRNPSTGGRPKQALPPKFSTQRPRQ